jgi:hypothetical protein
MDSQTIINILVGILLLFLPVILLLWKVKKLQKQERADTRSPFSQKLLRPAGESLRLKIDEIRNQIDDCLAPMALGLVAPGVFCMAISKTSLFSVVFFTSIAGIISWVIAWFKWKKFRSLRKNLINYRLGFDGERCVAAELTPLLSCGYHVYHDFIFDMYPGGDRTTFNIDHIAVGPEGVFVIETKAKRKSLKPPVNELQSHEIAVETKSPEGVMLRFPNGSRDNKAIVQARRQANQLRAWLNMPELTTNEVRPIVVFPGWMIKSDKWRKLGIQSARKLATRIPELGRGRNLTPEEVQYIAVRLEDKCRDIEGAS